MRNRWMMWTGMAAGALGLAVVLQACGKGRADDAAPAASATHSPAGV